MFFFCKKSFNDSFRSLTLKPAEQWWDLISKMRRKYMTSLTSHQELLLYSVNVSLVTCGKNVKIERINMGSLSGNASFQVANGPNQVSVFMQVHTNLITILHHLWTRLLRLITDMHQPINILAQWMVINLIVLISPQMKMQWSIQPVSVLLVTSLISHLVLQSPVNNVFKLNRRLLKLLKLLKENLKANIIL